ncbi:hypothetical protein [Priestia koreensis]|uniref:hypothetical protein n=1 Tax=Priestia koreensis TaxID=284581 RepID=UPI00204258DC|nr:hypothetical protein [Priestia koreensis]MCM3005699.1 hypothetical protein [Priestia koreensis]
MKTRIFLYGDKGLAFSFKKRDIKSIFDKQAICDLVSKMYFCTSQYYDFEIDELNDILEDVKHNHIAFIMQGQDLAVFDPTDYLKAMDEIVKTMNNVSTK